MRVVRWLATLSLAAAVGCGPPPSIQTETTIRPDGSCLRETWQPKDRLLPDGALEPPWNALWERVEDVPGPPIFADVASPNDPRYFHAVGVFASAAAIPVHFRKSIEGRPELGSGELVPSYERRDYGLFVEHRWSETLTNGVTREGFERARDEFVDLAPTMLAEALPAVYAAEFDVDEAKEEVVRRGGAILRDVLDGWYEAASIGDAGDASTQRLKGRFAEALERAGVSLRDADGSLVDGEECERRILAHLGSRIVAGFRRKDGSPPTADQVARILGSRTDLQYSKAWSDYVESRKPEMEARLVPLLVRMTGYYAYPPILLPPVPRFAFAVRLPGDLIRGETNGEVDPAGAVRWRFDARRLFPSGYTMIARSVVPTAAAQSRLLGRVAIPDAASALAVRRLTDQDPDLVAALRHAAEVGSLSDLSPVPSDPPERRDRRVRLLELLKAIP